MFDAGWPRREARQAEGLARVDVAKAGDDFLIQERDFDWRPSAGARARQRRAVELGGQRFETHRREWRPLTEVGARHEVHDAEPPRVVEADPHARLQLEDDMIVRLRGGVGVMHPKRARHSKVHEERFTGRQVGQQIFATTCQAVHRRSSQPALEISWEGPAQVGAAQQDADDSRAAQRGFQFATYGFDFR